MNFALCDAVHHYTSVVPHIRGLHLCDVKVSCLLGDKTPIVLLYEVWVLIEDPRIGKVCKTNRDEILLQMLLKELDILYYICTYMLLRQFRWPDILPPEEVGVPQSSTTPCPSRTDTALLEWTLK